jgi:hypothetical protein
MAQTQIRSSQFGDGELINADVSPTAAIDGTKISPDFGAQDITTSGGLTLTADGATNFQIGTGTPVTTAHIFGNGRFESTTLNTLFSLKWTTPFPGTATWQFNNPGTGHLWAQSENATPLKLSNNASAGNSLVVDDSGNVGVGTSSPFGGIKLDVAGKIHAGDALLVGDSSTHQDLNIGVQVYTDSSAWLSTMMWASGGPGQGTPGYRTRASSGASISSPTVWSTSDDQGFSGLYGEYYTGFEWGPSAHVKFLTDTSGGAIGSGSSPGKIVFRTTPGGSTTLADRMEISSEGLVGIGTSNPTEDFHISKSVSGGDVQMMLENTSDTASSSATLRIDTAGSTAKDPGIFWRVVGQQSYYMGIDNSDSDKLVIGRSEAIGSSVAIAVDSAGLVGIANASPAWPLDVVGSIKASQAVIVGPGNGPGTGEIRLAPTSTITYRDNGNSTDIDVLTMDGSDIVKIGGSVSASAQTDILAGGAVVATALDTGLVGIGIAVPAEDLHISKSSSGSAVTALIANTATGVTNCNAELRLETSSVTNALFAGISFRSLGLSTGWSILTLPVSNNRFAIYEGGGAFGTGTERFGIDAGGEVTVATSLGIGAQAAAGLALYAVGKGHFTDNVGIGVSPDESLTVKSHASYANSGHRLTTAAVQTTDETVTAIKTIALADNTTYIIKAMVVGREATNNRAAYQLSGCFYREGAGVATLQGSVSTDFSEESNASWDATLAVTGNNVEVRVTGVSAVTVNWTATVEYQAVTTNS